ncbi:hypothetical protein H7U19_10380 [Hyunsoonleella sp. SJ7]|uniref:HTH luxR-type domain-containing protein n=1 Tax=Hyunsoonleella aquatilis TaxID=2762758 RepID=A0A923KGP7_9FLAO|nr:LuxR C-terminal-related transcriptional regulator [Hyunsoonleella aquatilis]MBC3758811.1 hypothetical protein [Hyunsoonleella aquatilis]
MTAYKEIIRTINDLKKNGYSLSKKDIIMILKATKSITPHKDTVNSLIVFLSTLDSTYDIDNLTKREEQVLKLIGNGASSLDIAKKLELSTSTVETHRKNIRKKLKLVGKGKLIQFAILYNLKHPSEKKAKKQTGKK